MTAKIKVEIDFFMARNHRHATVSRNTVQLTVTKK